MNIIDCCPETLLVNLIDTAVQHLELEVSFMPCYIAPIAADLSWSYKGHNLKKTEDDGPDIKHHNYEFL